MFHHWCYRIAAASSQCSVSTCVIGPETFFVLSVMLLNQHGKSMWMQGGGQICSCWFAGSWVEPATFVQVDWLQAVEHIFQVLFWASDMFMLSCRQTHVSVWDRAASACVIGQAFFSCSVHIFLISMASCSGMYGVRGFHVELQAVEWSQIVSFLFGRQLNTNFR